MSEATVTLTICAKYHTDGYRALVDAAVGHVDEIVVAIDEGADEGIEGYRPEVVTYHRRPLKKDFASQSNFLMLQAKSDWILSLDTDENLTPWLWQRIRMLADFTIEEAILFPVRNIIIGYQDYLAWPDYHHRMYRRMGHIQWIKPVHQELNGYLSCRKLPAETRYAVQHVKTVEMQRRSEQHYA